VTNQVVLAIDPGLRRTGWSILSSAGKLLDYGIIVIPPFKSEDIDKIGSDMAKCMYLASRLKVIIQNNRIDEVVCEQMTGSQSARALRAMALAGGVVAGLCSSHKINWISPRYGKLALTGKPHANKHEMIEAARRLYSFKFQNISASGMEHIADSIGIFMHWRNNANEIE
jgi:Holliday junction resolvasome RuvABC endonuclease subunit